jgi:methionine synthase II (cobalamin-independent)
MAAMGNLQGLATGIGSLPHKNADEALDLIFQYCPEVPFWPQLPKRDAKEGMVAQFSEGFPFLEIKEKSLVFNPEEEKLTECCSHLVDGGDIDYFKISEEYASGLYAFKKRLGKSSPSVLAKIKHIKLHLTGPFTFAAGIKDENGVALLHDSSFMQAISEGLALKALWQIRQFEGFGKKIILFIDEPYLGCFGSAYTPINREDVVRVFSELTNKLVSQGGTLRIGVHCCGNTDWSMFTDVRLINIISFDAFAFLDRLLLYADDLKKFFEQGRALCWGIVPTQEFSEFDTPEVLVEKVKSGIEALIKKGVSAEKVLQDIFFSPACGLGTLDPSKAEQIFRVLSDLAASFKK